MRTEPDATHSNRDILTFYCQEIHFKSNLVGGRVNALLSSQSFLVIAYGTTMVASIDRWENASATILTPALALLGVVMTLLAWPGIRGAKDVLEL